MNQLIGFLVLLVMTLPLTAQEINKDRQSAPFSIDRRILSGLDIPSRPLRAHPQREYFQKRIYQGSQLNIYILSSETAVNKISGSPIDEFVYFMNGRADMQPRDGDEFSFFAGDYICIPKGFSGTWTNNGGNKYHLELSVISNKRADSTAVSKINIPFLLDKELLSGIGLTKDTPKSYRDILYSGVELEIVTESEEPTQKELVNTPKEQFIHVLQGLVTIHSKKGTSQTFYKGDFFVLPKGFTGSWKSEGHHLFRTIRVTQI